MKQTLRLAEEEIAEIEAKNPKDLNERRTYKYHT